jgi:hypothetical protein
MSQLPPAAERRRFPRHVRSFEGAWRGASGGAGCQIADISWGGCFVESAATPSRGEHTELTLLLDGESITLRGRVVAVFRGVGFSVRFDGLTGRSFAALYPVLGEPAPGVEFSERELS